MLKFKNPVAPHDSPDPFMTYDPVTKYYYALFTCHTMLKLYRSRNAGTIIKDNDFRIIYEAGNDGILGDIWAPEMHRGSNGKWYIYTSGRLNLKTNNKRLFIMEGPEKDPFDGEWMFKVMPSPDIYSIDPTIYTAPDKTQYLCASRVDPKYGQVLDIYDMINPYTLGKKSATIAKAELPWELVPPYVDDLAIVEGAFFLKRNERLFIIYSANGCWSDHYCLGILEHTGGEICDAANWKKHDKPLFTYGNGVYGPGHASFFSSPDGTEVWCAYHGMKEHNENVTETTRFFNLQRVDFNEDDFPVMSLPTGYDTEITPPSGE